VSDSTMTALLALADRLASAPTHAEQLAASSRSEHPHAFIRGVLEGCVKDVAADIRILIARDTLPVEAHTDSQGAR
jgi:hypothetical protein